MAFGNSEDSLEEYRRIESEAEELTFINEIRSRNK